MIQIKKSHEGKLHKALGLPTKSKIPVSDLYDAAASKSPAMRKMANFAINAKKWKH